ncbi:MAG: hypothetical protein HYZ00_06585 [Candidatus Hydrogenedentes bacterium]|nr:hypothetical protein [Candidatus Hydrogenedentota bacterium]
MVLPNPARLAVMRAGRHARYWSEESPLLNQETTAKFLDALRECPRISSAAPLPGILIPERQSMPYMREAAARYQADLLLIYRQETGSYEKYRIARSDQVKAYCTIEAVLLDVRSGTVPFTTVAFEEIRAGNAADDISFGETVDRAFHEAEIRALLQVATALIQHLNGLRE